MQKIKEKILRYTFSRSTFLRKITFSIIKNNKLRIFYSSLLLLFASFLISISINLPVNIENYKTAILNQNSPYKSVVYYQSNPFNSPNFSFDKNIDDNNEKVFDKNGNINNFIKPTFDTYNPFDENDIEKHNIIKDGELDVSKITDLSFLAGQVWNKKFIDLLNQQLTGIIKNLVCSMSGDPDANDKAGDCVTWMIKKNAPGYISNNLNDPNFALTFGAIPFTKEKEELLTVVNGSFSKKNTPHLTNIWGVNLDKTRLDLKKYQKVLEKDGKNDFLPVVINKTIAKNYKLKINDEINFNCSYHEVKQNGSEIGIDKLSKNLPFVPSVKPVTGKSSEWTYGGTKDELETDDSASSYFYDKKNYFYLTSGNANKKDKIKIDNILSSKKLRVVGITNDYGYGRFYADQKLLNNILEPQTKVVDTNDSKYHDFFKNNFFNTKLSMLKNPQDYNTYSVYQPYGDYSPVGLNGGTIECKDVPLSFNQNGLGSVDNLFSNEMFNNAYNSLLIALSILFIVIICLAIGISLIIIAVTNSNILQDNKKNLFVMKALGYTDKEINNIISKIYSYILFFVFFISLIFVYFSTIYAMNFIFTTKDIFVPTAFKLWEIPLGLLLLFIIYYLNKIISFNIIKKLTLSSELKK